MAHMNEPMDKSSIAGIGGREQIVREFPQCKGRSSLLYAGLGIAVVLLLRGYSAPDPRLRSTMVGAGIVVGILAFLLAPTYYSQVLITNQRLVAVGQKHWLFGHGFSVTDLALREVVGAQFRYRKRMFFNEFALVLALESGTFLDLGTFGPPHLGGHVGGFAVPKILLVLFIPFLLVLVPVWLLLRAGSIFRKRVIRPRDIAEDVYSTILEIRKGTSVRSGVVPGSA